MGIEKKIDFSLSKYTLKGNVNLGMIQGDLTQARSEFSLTDIHLAISNLKLTKKQKQQLWNHIKSRPGENV